jgi:hypothetical protein
MRGEADGFFGGCEGILVALDLDEASGGILPSAEVRGVKLCGAQEERCGLLAASSHSDGVGEVVEGAAIFGIASNIGGIEGEIASPMRCFEAALEGTPEHECDGSDDAEASERRLDG